MFDFDSTTREIGQISAAKYKLRARADEQAKLFPQLEAEIKERRARLNQKVVNQCSDEYRDAICEEVTKSQLAPEDYQEELCERVLRPFSDRLWMEGCAPPQIKQFQAHIEMKPNVSGRVRQPYTLSKFDEARLAYLLEEEENEGKIEPLGLGEDPPHIVVPTFIVDKKGSLLGRRVGDYTDFNLLTEDYFWPAPDGEAVLSRATGKKHHSTLDCVWGFRSSSVTSRPLGCCQSSHPLVYIR